jgi:purine-binding chemotaxis protein CheW
MDANQYLTFQLAGEEYAVAIRRVKEIITYGPLTTVPQAPAAVRGMINLRGSVVAVIDLAIQFGLPASPPTNRTCIVILEVDFDGASTVIGILADAVNEVVEIFPEDILPVPAFGTTTRKDFLRGMGKAGAKFVLILTIENVLTAVGSNGVSASTSITPSGISGEAK